MLNKQIETFLIESHGQPNRVNKKVSAWALNSNADIVLETNYELASKSHTANLWLPGSYKSSFKLNKITFYQEGKGRHSNTYASRGLERGKAAIKIKLFTLPEAKELLSSIK
jgi:hypothetical protein